MRGVNLRLFDFDYDLTWVAFFMNANGHVYGRYGGRDEGPADAHLTLPGLKYAMRQALASHRRDPKQVRKDPILPAETVESYPAAARHKEECIHCHQVYDFRRDALLARKQWDRSKAWVYPPPKNVGIELDPAQGDRIVHVAPGSAAEKAGLRAGDLLRAVNGLPVASFADAQYALHRAPTSGSLPVARRRNGRTGTSNLTLNEGWRRSDITWRASMWGLPPVIGVWGSDLKPEEKKGLGLSAGSLAFRQGSPLTRQAKATGLRPNDVIIGLDDHRLEMTMLQFNAWVRTNYNVGDRVTLRVIRDGKRIDLPTVLPETDGF
jgi:hypothetical protein